MLKVSIIGGSGYAGGELLRILLFHPEVEIYQVTSQKYVGRSVGIVHPNLRMVTSLKFCSLEELKPCDLLFIALPNLVSVSYIERSIRLAKKVIDLGSDFRLKNKADYQIWYGIKHSRPELLSKFIYGLVELHRAEIRQADWIACGGCEATAAILGLYPLLKNKLIDPQKIFIDVKIGSSAAGSQPTLSSHHPERAGCIRSFKPTMHRHTAEIEQELNFGEKPTVHFSATAIEAVRGILATIQTFLVDKVDESQILKTYLREYRNEPFIRILSQRDGIYRFPEPKILSGTNYCDLGFEKDNRSHRLVVLAAIDNLVKGTAGQAVQAMNVMFNFEEKLGLEFSGLHPI